MMEKARKWQIVALAFAVMFFLAVSFASAGDTYPQFPWSTWGELSQTITGRDNPGFKADGYLEQGIDWMKIGNSKFSPVLNTFVGFRFTASSQPDFWWDNKFGPWFGAKLKWDVSPYPGAYGEVALGIRGEYYTYVMSSGRDRPYDNDLRCVAFFQWSFGGKW